MKILVTGGAGYVGSNLIKALLEKNEYGNLSIVSLDNYFTGNASNHVEGDKVEYISGDTQNIDKIFLINDFDIIFHFGEYSRIVYSFEDIQIVHNSIVKGTFAVLQFALKNKSKLIYSASSSKFGNGGENENLSPYAFLKSKNIELIKNYHKWFGLNYEIAYFFNVYGKNHISVGKYATVIAIFERQYKNGLPLTVVGDGKQSRDFTHIDDVCNALLKILEQNKNYEYHLRFGRNYKILDIAKAFGTSYVLIPERRGERFISEDFNSDTNKVLDWNAQVELFKYIENLKK